MSDFCLTRSVVCGLYFEMDFSVSLDTPVSKAKSCRWPLKKRSDDQVYKLCDSMYVVENPKYVYDPDPVSVSRDFMATHLTLLGMLVTFYDPHCGEEEEAACPPEKAMLGTLCKHFIRLRRFSCKELKEEAGENPMYIPHSVLENHLGKLNKLLEEYDDHNQMTLCCCDGEISLQLAHQILVLKRYAEKVDYESQGEERTYHLRP